MSRLAHKSFVIDRIGHLVQSFTVLSGSPDFGSEYNCRIRRRHKEGSTYVAYDKGSLISNQCYYYIPVLLRTSNHPLLLFSSSDKQRAVR